jgi:hypothetical protein
VIHLIDINTLSYALQAKQALRDRSVTYPLSISFLSCILRSRRIFAIVRKTLLGPQTDCHEVSYSCRVNTSRLLEGKHSMLNTSDTANLHAHAKAAQAVQQSKTNSSKAAPKAVLSRALTAMMQHGGLYSLIDTDMMNARFAAVATTLPELFTPTSTFGSFTASVSQTAQSFFQHLVQQPYTIHSNLMSHIAFPHEGQTYTSKKAENDPTESAKLESPELPAATTFIGQFIDHDLTMNAVDLFISQVGDIENTASPLIDLDSVYGPRSLLDTVTDLYEADGRTLRLQTVDTGDGHTYYDLVRDATGTGMISDKRNDENQMILQVHLLIMRVHNKLAADYPELTAEELRREVVLNWQSVLVNDHLRNVLDGATLDHLLGEIIKPDFGDFFYKPLCDLRSNTYVTCLPHEFAIAFRYGHSQLKPAYAFRASNPLRLYRLFDNTQVASANGATTDLRGSQPLPKEHVIDWDFFATTKFRGNRIDGKVTSAVFDLPESAIPDDIKFIGNLVHRNLIRSQQIGLCSGEDLAQAYKIAPLDHKVVDGRKEHWPLYQQDPLPNTDGFRTPLWYYILREAQQCGTTSSSKLGPLGSRLVGEVILGAIHWGSVSYFNASGLADPGQDCCLNLASTQPPKKWTSKVLKKLNNTSSSQVKFLDLAHYVGPQPV